MHRVLNLEALLADVLDSGTDSGKRSVGATVGVPMEVIEQVTRTH